MLAALILIVTLALALKPDPNDVGQQFVVPLGQTRLSDLISVMNLFGWHLDAPRHKAKLARTIWPYDPNSNTYPNAKTAHPTKNY